MITKTQRNKEQSVHKRIVHVEKVKFENGRMKKREAQILIEQGEAMHKKTWMK